MIRFFTDKVDVPGGLENLLVPVMEKICGDHSRNVMYINVVFVSDEKLLEINRDFLRHDYYTDIITFNYADEPESNIEGELYISVDRVRDNAKNLGIAEEEEFKRVVVHGVLHLCGHKDNEVVAQKQMQLAEDKYINQIVPRET